MRGTTLLAAAMLLALSGNLGGCPQGDATQVETDLSSDANALTPAPTTPTSELPTDRRPGVNPLAPMPVPVEVPPLRPGDTYWTNAQGRIGWFSDPADGVPVPGPDETLNGTPPDPPPAPETRGRDFVDPSAALEFAVRQFDAVARVFSLFGELGNEKFWYEPMMMTSWGRCPRATVLSGQTTSIAAFRFGGGCAAPSIGGETGVGSCGYIIYPDPTPAATYVTDDVTIGGRSVRPHLRHPRISASLPVLMNATLDITDNGVSVSGPCDFELVGVGRAVGDLLLHILPDYVFEFEHGALTVTGALRAADLAIAGLRTQPALHGNFIPDVGTLRFTATLADGPHRVVIMYRAGSPIDGVVQASLDGGDYFDYTLPADLLE